MSTAAAHEATPLSCAPAPIGRTRRLITDALAISMVGGIGAYLLLGRPPLTGIDDANITQVYAANLAHGRGYVYTPGGGRVEGSTSLLWTLINAVIFLISERPEWLVAVVCTALTAAAVMCALSLADIFSAHAGVSREVTHHVTVLAILASPSFFAWSVWTLMDLALWVTVLQFLVLQLALQLTEDSPPRSRTWLITLCAVAAPLTRPEGIAVALGLLALSACLTFLRKETACRSYRPYVTAAAMSVAAVCFLTLGRLAYFGQPVPNTFYAKISSGLRQQLHGIQYLLQYLAASPYVALYLLCWLALTTIARSRRRVPDDHTWELTILAVATIAGMLMLYVVLGGDHFDFYRFYQPLSLLLPIALGLGCAYVWEQAGPFIRERHGTRLALCAGAVLYLLTPVATFTASASGLREEFDFAVNGRRLGQLLRRLPVLPSVGVVAAGGFAREYPGRTYDLMGLNWVAMAHADPTKTGSVRSHAGFSFRVFWEARPDLVAFSGDRCAEARPWQLDPFDMTVLKGLPNDAQFRQEYQAVSAGCYYGFARKELLHQPAARAILMPIR